MQQEVSIIGHIFTHLESEAQEVCDLPSVTQLSETEVGSEPHIFKAFQLWHTKPVQTQEQVSSPRRPKQGLSQPGPWWTIPSLVLGDRLLVIQHKMALAFGFPLPSCGISPILLTSRSKQDPSPQPECTLHIIA